MKISEEQRRRLDEALERLFQKKKTVIKELNYKEGESAAPRPAGDVENDPLCAPANTEFVKRIDPENSIVDGILMELLSDAPRPADPSSLVKLGEDNLWVWGGPTPLWGGSMADDTLIRGADYFDAANVVYVYGPTNEKMLGLHSKYKRMLCQVNSNCRTKGAQGTWSDEENAEYLSKISLQFPNVTGAMCDDLSTGFRKVLLPEKFERCFKALKKHNPALKMYSVVYAHELDTKDFSHVLPYLDVVNLWFWNKDEILEYDEKVQLCQEKFPGKPIIQGIFLHEYGRSDVGTPPELLLYQLEKSREYLTKGVLEGVILLGDREIKKWPKSAQAVRDYLKNQ